MSGRAGMCGLALLAALSVQAAESGAPLEDSKKELKAFQKGQATPGREGGVDKLRDAMPQMLLPSSEVAPLDPLAAEKSAKELKKKKAAEKNWLVNGVERLDKNSKSAGARDTGDDAAAAAKTEGDQPETGDPEYLLKVYNEQQKRDDAKAEAKPSAASHGDPLKPFLTGWLSDSPARGKFFDEYVRKPDSGVGFNGTAGQGPQDTGGGSGLSGLDLAGRGPKGDREAATPVQANPYLQGLDMSVLQDTASRRTPVNSVPAFQPAPPPPAANPVLGPVPAVRQAEKKAPFSPQADDKKYFPQLKKF